MAVRQDVIERSRIGRLLVNRGLIDERQLAAALAAQEAGQRLGEVLVASGAISERDLNRALKHQQRYRYAAAFLAMAVAPLQPAIALAAGSTVPAPKSMNALELRGGMRALDDEEMATVGARGIEEDLQQLSALVSRHQAPGGTGGGIGGRDDKDHQSGEGLPEGIEVMGTLGKIFFPLANVLDATVEMEGVHFDPSRLKPLITEDGRGFNINLPSRIDRLSFIDIRPAGTHGATMGSMHFEGIQFSENASLVIRPY